MRDIIRLGQVETVRKRLNEATQSLLGDTIVLSDAEWQQPSLLPGWSRAHVATHLARGADALSHVLRNTASGRMVPLYANEGQRLADIERGSERSGLELQIDLDTAAGALEEAFAEVVDWLVPVTLPIGEHPLAAVTIARLHEVCLHHLDLDTGFASHLIDPVPARWLLQWSCDRLAESAHVPAVDVRSASGVSESLGGVGERREVTGTDAALWGWVTGREDGSTVDAAEGVLFPLSS